MAVITAIIITIALQLGRSDVRGVTYSTTAIQKVEAAVAE